jgi:serine O-acetyltransferase
MKRELSRKSSDLPQLVDEILASYRADARTQRIEQQFLPNKQTIIEITDLLLELTYPGFIGRHELNWQNAEYHAGAVVGRLYDTLTTEIEQCLCFEREVCEQPPDENVDCSQIAVETTDAFLREIPVIRALLTTDVQAAYDGDPAATSTAEIILAYPAIIAITIYRYAHALQALRVPMMPRIMTEHAHRLTGIDIHPGATIGPSFFIDHGTGVVIGETCEIGAHVKIYQGVTLGALSFPKDARGRLIRGEKRHPTVRDHVTVYANATVLGADTVLGEGAVVGGSVFLTRSVEPYHQVSMTPPDLKIRPPREQSSTS